MHRSKIQLRGSLAELSYETMGIANRTSQPNYSTHCHEVSSGTANSHTKSSTTSIIISTRFDYLDHLLNSSSAAITQA